VDPRIFNRESTRMNAIRSNALGACERICVRSRQFTVGFHGLESNGEIFPVSGKTAPGLGRKCAA
jgi:hypothetical protein